MFVYLCSDFRILVDIHGLDKVGSGVSDGLEDVFIKLLMAEFNVIRFKIVHSMSNLIESDTLIDDELVVLIENARFKKEMSFISCFEELKTSLVVSAFEDHDILENISAFNHFLS